MSDPRVNILLDFEMLGPGDAAKVIGVGPTRAEAIARLEEALARSTVAIEGGASNRALLLELLAHDDGRNARMTTRWLDGHLTRRGGAHSRPNLDGALVAAAVREYQRARDEERAEVFRRAQRGMPQGVPQPNDAASAVVAVRIVLDLESRDNIGSDGETIKQQMQHLVALRHGEIIK